jgi:hypothetical protein
MHSLKPERVEFAIPSIPHGVLEVIEKKNRTPRKGAVSNLSGLEAQITSVPA